MILVNIYPYVTVKSSLSLRPDLTSSPFIVPHLFEPRLLDRLGVYTVGLLIEIQPQLFAFKIGFGSTRHVLYIAYNDHCEGVFLVLSSVGES